MTPGQRYTNRAPRSCINGGPMCPWRIANAPNVWGIVGGYTHLASAVVGALRAQGTSGAYDFSKVGGTR